MRIAHFSDPHLLSLTGTRWLDFANKRWIGGMNLLVKRGRHHRTEVFEAMVDDLNAIGVDHILCTGDVTNLALEEEFRFARGHFDRIALDPDHVTVIPGNHDAYVARGAAHFVRHFAEFFRADARWRQGGGDPWPVVRVRGPVALIALSTSLQTPWFTAFGRLGAEQIDRLRRVLGDERLRGKLRLVAIHHPPAGRMAHSRVRGLHDRDELARALAELGAEIVLHGHEHRDASSAIEGPGGQSIPVRGIQSGTFVDGERPELCARYRIYDVGDAGGARPQIVGEELRCWDPDASRFAADEALPQAAAATV